MKTTIFLVIGALVALLILGHGLGIINITGRVNQGDYDEFAQCILDSGAKFYGTYWCPHCNDQKVMFGDSWNILKDAYVECSLPNREGQTQACIDAAIRVYPTWRFADQSELTGKQNFLTLSQKTGCDLENFKK